VPSPLDRSSYGLTLLAASAFLSVSTEMTPVGLLPGISADLHVSEARLGLLVTGYAFMVAIFATPLAALTARMPRRALLICLLLGYTVSNVIMMCANGFPVAAGARVLGGLVHALFWSVVPGYAARLVPPGKVGRATTVVFTGGSIAFAAGVPLGTALGTAVGWRATFGLLALLPLIVIALLLKLIPPLPGATRGNTAKLSAAIRLPGVALIAGTTTVIMLGHYALYTYISPFVARAGVGSHAIGPVLFCYGATGLIGTWTAAALVDRHPRGVLLTALGLVCGSMVVLALFGQGTVIAVLATVPWGLAFGALPALLQTTVLRAAPALPESASALFAGMFNVGIGGGALVGGLVLDQAGLGGLPVFAAVLTGAGLVVASIARRTAFPALARKTAVAAPVRSTETATKREL
jgi:predicted MFS family arabinose efflux permease